MKFMCGGEEGAVAVCGRGKRLDQELLMKIQPQKPAPVVQTHPTFLSNFFAHSTSKLSSEVRSDPFIRAARLYCQSTSNVLPVIRAGERKHPVVLEQMDRIAEGPGSVERSRGRGYRGAGVRYVPELTRAQRLSYLHEHVCQTC